MISMNELQDVLKGLKSVEEMQERIFAYLNERGIEEMEEDDYRELEASFFEEDLEENIFNQHENIGCECCYFIGDLGEE